MKHRREVEQKIAKTLIVEADNIRVEEELIKMAQEISFDE